MKRLIPFLFLVSTPAYADITHSIQNVVSVSTLGASSTATRIGTTFSSSGTNVTPSANSVDNAIGTLNLAAAGISDGVPALDYDTTYTVKNAGDAYSVTETYLEGDAIPDLLGVDVTDGVIDALPVFGETLSFSGGDIGDTEMTLNSAGEMEITLTDAGAGVTAQMQSTITLEID